MPTCKSEKEKDTGATACQKRIAVGFTFEFSLACSKTDDRAVPVESPKFFQRDKGQTLIFGGRSFDRPQNHHNRIILLRYHRIALSFFPRIIRLTKSTASHGDGGYGMWRI